MAKPCCGLPESLGHGTETIAASSKALSWSARRDWLRAEIESRLPSTISNEELNVHFSAMPSYYWERVTESDLIWGLETIHGFLELIASPQVPPTAPFVSWRQVASSGKLRVMLCTWDRHGLLAKVAAAVSAVRLNILEADVFTRSDSIVLDLFTISGADGHSPVTPAQMDQMAFLLDGALSEPPRFASVWACCRHKYVSPSSYSPVRIICNNDSSVDSTVVHIEAPDRLGLLYDLLQAVADGGLQINQAHIETKDGVACDIVHVTNKFGGKVQEKEQLDSLRARLEAALAVSD